MTDKLDEAFERAYRLRVQFAGALSEAAIKKKAGILIAAIVQVDFSIGYPRRDELTYMDIIGVTGNDEDNDYNIVKDATEANPYRALLAYTLYVLGDDSGENCHNYYAQYTGNHRLDKVYDILEALGYEKSDEEKELLDGTSTLYAPSEEKGDD